MRWFFVLVLLSVSWAGRAQMVQRYPLELCWNGIVEERMADDTLLYISLESGQNEGAMPTYVHAFPIYDSQVKAEVALEKVVAAPLSDEELQIASQFSYGADFELKAVPMRSRDESLLSVSVVPFRQVGGRYEKLMSATLSVALTPEAKHHSAPVYAQTSEMATGQWYKIGLPETGIYKLTYSDLNTLGLDLSSLDPRNLRIYHNGGGVLPELNAEARHDDLVEIPIYVYGEEDGRFDQGDYILFYGGGPICWKYNTLKKVFVHEPNPYDDYAYAFVVTGKGRGRRISEVVPPADNAAVIVSEFIDYQVYESKEYSLFKVGRTFYGDIMDGNASRNYTFEFPNAVGSRMLTLNSELAGRNEAAASFEVYVNGNKMGTYGISPFPNDHYYGSSVSSWVTTPFTGNTVEVKITHKGASNSSSTGYVDFLSLNVWRRLVYTGAQMRFRNPEASESNKVYEYQLSGASQQVQVWNITDPVSPSVVKGQLSGNVFSFKVNGNPDNAFFAFNSTSYCSAKLFGRIDNQNLHGIRDVDYVILTYSDFISQAERLKAIHAQYSPDLNVFITTPELVYNEFSCGAKDISAIRDFGRMLYLESSPGRKIKYLLLLGDCTFDYKNRTGIFDLVPTYETKESLNMHEAFVTDDFFGFFDEDEGDIGKSLADIGIGRFPVNTLEQATQMVDKIERYIAKSETTMNSWRNQVTFFADDGEREGFMKSAEELVSYMPKVGGDAAVVDKIYLDAYQKESSPGGEICPEMNAAINRRMEKGTSVLVYVGHGGEVQLADERILQKKDVDSWRNGPMYPLMVTGTCEFSRYDDHTRTSLGEFSFLNPYGGMVAMFTTSRITDGGTNNIFIKGVFNNLFSISGEEHRPLGDVYRMAKTKGNYVEKRYVFFGDPALRLAYPKWRVETLSINGKYPEVWTDSLKTKNQKWETYTVYSDTISALQPVEIEGVVKDLSGNVASGFNGVVHVTVYDKAAEISTYDNKDKGKTFMLRNSVIFNGQTEVTNGRFKVDFIVPRDIAYRYGTGMISYYATDYNVDANGICEDFIIGGFYDDPTDDNDPPEIRLFIDDTLFVSGGITGESPLLLAFVEDESGINTTGAGIGHDIMATLSGVSRSAYCLNDYFAAELDNPGKGQIAFKMQGLVDGDYTLTLKVWDIYNNSNTATIDFTVVNSSGMSVENLGNYPNPVTDETYFVFDHNQVGNNLKVQIDIFDVMGRWVTRLSETVEGNSVRMSPIRWNGRGANGEVLKNGVYVYRLLTTNDQGETASMVSKLILNK